MNTCLFHPATANSAPADRPNGYAYSLKGIRIDDAGDAATTARTLFETHLDRHAGRIAIVVHGRA